MCYPKPGPRCSHHAQERLKKALTRLSSVTSDYNEAADNLRDLHANEKGWEFSEDQLPKRTVGRVKTAQTRVLSCHRMLDATPEGKQSLEKAYGQALTTVNGIITEMRDLEAREMLDTDEAKSAHAEWSQLNEDRMSAFSIYTRLKNRHKKALDYREFCLQEYNREQQRARHYKEMQRHSLTGDIGKYAKAQDKMKKLNEERSKAPVAEYFYRVLPTFSQTSASFPLSVGQEERSTHYLELSQGGKVTVENKSMILETGDSYTVHHMSEISFLNNPQGDEGTRRGYGSSLKGKAAVFNTQGKQYSTQEAAMEDLEKNRLQNSYLLTNKTVYSLLAQIDGNRLKELHAEVQANYPAYKERKDALFNRGALSA